MGLKAEEINRLDHCLHKPVSLTVKRKCLCHSMLVNNFDDYLLAVFVHVNDLLLALFIKLLDYCADILADVAH